MVKLMRVKPAPTRRSAINNDIKQIDKLLYGKLFGLMLRFEPRDQQLSSFYVKYA